MESCQSFEQGKPHFLKRLGGALVSLAQRVSGQMSNTESLTEGELRHRAMLLINGEAAPDYVPDFSKLPPAPREET